MSRNRIELPSADTELHELLTSDEVLNILPDCKLIMQKELILLPDGSYTDCYGHYKTKTYKFSSRLSRKDVMRFAFRFGYRLGRETYRDEVVTEYTKLKFPRL